jgi:hypothetical protein
MGITRLVAADIGKAIGARVAPIIADAAAIGSEAYAIMSAVLKCDSRRLTFSALSAAAFEDILSGII